MARKPLLITCLMGFACLMQSPFSVALSSAFSLGESLPDRRLHVYADGQVLSPATQISTLEQGWAPDSLGSYAQAKARLGSRLPINTRFSIGVEKRLDYLVHFDDATSDFYSAIERNQLPQGRYPLNLYVNGARSQGFNLTYFIPLSNYLSFRVTGHLLSSNRVQQGYLSGVGVVGPDDQVSYEYELDYHYDQQRLLDGPAQSVSGWGHSFDLTFHGQLSNGWSYDGEFKDVFYHLYWSNLDHDKGCLSRPLDSACSVKTQQGAFNQSLPSSTLLALNYQFQQGESVSPSVSVQYEGWARYQAAWLSMEVTKKSQALQLAWDTTQQILRLGYESSWLKVKWQADRASVKKAHFGRLALDVYWPL